jgi:predicted AlkP superfamily pyrophosphatase or phosphodiesterase
LLSLAGRNRYDRIMRTSARQLLSRASVLAGLACLSLVVFGHHARRAVAQPALPPQPAVAAQPAVVPDSTKEGLHAHVHHVLIISEDGLRPDALRQLHLHWHELLRHRGSVAKVALTIRDASTLPAHASMLSSVLPSEHGLTWNNWQPKRGYIKVPTIFTEAKEAGLTTAFFTGKKKLRHIVPPGTVGIYERPAYYCKGVAQDAAAYIIAQKPALTFVHFADPDELGHSQGWMSPGQMHAIANSDRCLGVLYEALETAGIVDDTLIIVSADHGGHNKVHSGRTRIDRMIPWMACGPGVREDFVIPDEVSTMDTAATALYALGLPIPESYEGKPRTEIFLQP